VKEIREDVGGIKIGLVGTIERRNRPDHPRRFNILAQAVDRAHPERLVAVRGHLVGEITQRVDKAAQDEEVEIAVREAEGDAHPGIEALIEKTLGIGTLVLVPSVHLLMDRKAGDLENRENDEKAKDGRNECQHGRMAQTERGQYQVKHQADRAGQEDRDDKAEKRKCNAQRALVEPDQSKRRHQKQGNNPENHTATSERKTKGSVKKNLQFSPMQ
jgi:hypothetical protein